MSKTFVVVALLVSSALAGNVVRYSNQEITEKLFALRDSTTPGGVAATESISHGAKVRVEFSVQQTEPGLFKNKMIYNLKNEDGTWKVMPVDYECREINGKQLCYGKSCPIADYKPPVVPPSIGECITVARQATEVIQYLLLNNPDLLNSAKDIKQCVEDVSKFDKKVEEICFNRAIADIEKAKEGLEKQGFRLIQQPGRPPVWVREDLTKPTVVAPPPKPVTPQANPQQTVQPARKTAKPVPNPAAVTVNRRSTLG